MSAVKKFLLPLFFAIILGLVVWQVEPPESFTQASIFQITIFFIPLLLFLTFLTNSFLRFSLKSLILSLEIITLLLLQAIGLLNILTGIIVLASIILSIKFLKRPKKLGYQPKIPKLSQLSKQR